MSSKAGFRYLILSMAALLATTGMLDLAKGQLTRTNGLYGGIINSLVTDNGETYAVTPEFLYRYDETQEEWLNLNIRFANVSFDSFTTSDGKLFMGWSEGVEYGGEQVTLLKSDDQGETWQNISPPNNDDGVNSLFVVGDYIFIYTKKGSRFSSENEGESWQGIDLDDQAIVNVIRTDDNYFIRTFTDIHRSDDGISWEKLDIDFANNIQNFVSSDKELYILTQEDELLQSKDNGESWDLIYEYPYGSLINAGLFHHDEFLYITTNDPSEPDSLFYTSDYDEGWASVEMPENGRIIMKNSTIYLNAYPDLYYSEDFGETWQSANTKGLMTRSVNSFEVVENTILAGPDFSYSGQPGDLNISKNNGETWNKLEFDPEKGPARLHTATLDDNGNILAGAGYGDDRYLYRTEDGGESWDEISNTVLENLHQTDGTLFATGDTTGKYIPRLNISKLITSDDGGHNWSTITITEDEEFVNSLFVSDGKLFAVMNVQNHELYFSDDSGETWEKIFSGELSIHFAKLIGPDIYLGTSEGLQKGLEMGDVWQVIVPDQIIENAAVEGRHLFYTIDDKLFHLDTEVESITEISGEETGTINRLKIRENYLYAATQTGLWNMDISELPTSLGDNEDELPLQVKLEQNYPNPFNPTTNITYSLPNSGHVKLNVFDMLGRQVQTLVNEQISAGRHTVTFDASRLSSGFYFYKIAADQTTEIRKMLLIK